MAQDLQSLLEEPLEEQDRELTERIIRRVVPQAPLPVAAFNSSI